MIRSVCLLSRDYPPETGGTTLARSFEALARGLVELGVAVHVITRDPANQGRLSLQQGVAVHRIRSFNSGSSDAPELDRSLWALAAADYYQGLDRDVDFDVVLAPDLFGEALKLAVGAHTALVLQLFGSLPLRAEQPAGLESASARVAARLELEALCRATALVAPSDELATRARQLTTGDVHVLAPPCFFDHFTPPATREPNARLELVFHAPLQAGSGAVFSLEILAELKARGTAAHLSIIGNDSGAPGERYRRHVLIGLMERLSLGFSDVRFIDELDSEGIARHLRGADALVAARDDGELCLQPLEALACGLPTLVSASDPATSWFDGDPSVRRLSLDDTRTAIADGADFLQLLPQGRATQLTARVRGLFDPPRAAARYLELFEQLERRPRLDRRLRQPLRRQPKLGVVIPAFNAAAYTKRCIESLLEHTTVPLRLVVVDNSSVDTTAAMLASIEDDRFFPVLCTRNHGAAGGRNIGLDYLDGDEDYVVFLDNDTEVLAEWWVPFVDALEADPTAGLVGQDGVNVVWTETGRELQELVDDGIQPCDVIVGYCMFVRAASLQRIGRFDERFGLMWHDDDDFAMRAMRIGERVLRVPVQRVLHFEHRSSSTAEGIWDAPERPAALSATNQRYLAQKHRRQILNEQTPFLLLADAEEAVSDPSLLATWAAGFTQADAAALVLFGVGLDPIDYELRLAIAAEQAGIDLEHGPRVIALLPPTATDDEEMTIADEVFAVLSRQKPTGAFLHLPWYLPDSATQLRIHAARMWSVRPQPVRDFVGSATA